MLKLSTAMSLIPYLLVAGYGLLIARRGETYQTRPQERGRDLKIAIIATVYTAFLIYAGGMKFLLLSAILYAPGTVLYFWARRERNKRVFTAVEWVVFAVAVIGAVIGIHGLATGYITI
jgi:arginine:ornithine antiporter/lysine permease